MPRLPKAEVLENIRQAVVEVVAHSGIGAAGVADIAKAARVSPGTIYLHFTTREDMLQQTYLHLKRAFHAAMMTAGAGETTSAARIRSMWHAVFAFLWTRPLDFRFLEYAGAADLLTADQRAEIAPLQDEVHEVLRAAIADGTVMAMPIPVAMSLLLGPALHLARIASLSDRRPPQAEIDEVFDRLWSCLTP
ncbi:TetR/AcrR family transcriptional regulator [Devosia sp.]|uniref:TetR/AcrR family transcriptional regulator n=1 Tax=Devosia sp. TaxID=1871048 RepID=UPI003A8F18FE